MNLRTVAAIAALAFTPAALFAAEGTFDKTLPVNGPATLKVSTGSGFIHITPGPGGSIHIIGHVHSSNGWFSGSPEENVHRVTSNPPITQNGNSIEVGQHTHYRDISIDYVITAPRGTSVNAASGSGDVNVTNLYAPLRAETGSGNLFANQLTGDVYLNAGSGNIRAWMNHANQVRVGTGSGNLHLMGVTGGLYAEAGSGDIEITGDPGSDWKIITGSGSITLNTGSSRYALDATLGSGEFHSDPPLTMHGSYSHYHIVGDVNGSGGPTVRIQDGSGDVQIH